MFAKTITTSTPCFIAECDSSLFYWLTWRNGSLLKIFNIKHRYGPISMNVDTVRRYAIAYCETDDMPCKPEAGQFAVMFDTEEENCNPWWTHFTKREFLVCFPEFSVSIEG